MCNWLGNYAWTEALEWPGKDTYNKFDLNDLKFEGDRGKIGSVKSHGNLTFIKIHAAGHMVPLDQPEAGLEILNRWVGGEWK